MLKPLSMTQNEKDVFDLTKETRITELINWLK